MHRRKTRRNGKRKRLKRNFLRALPAVGCRQPAPHPAVGLQAGAGLQAAKNWSVKRGFCLFYRVKQAKMRQIIDYSEAFPFVLSLLQE
jgi:hypothetical protein